MALLYCSTYHNILSMLRTFGSFLCQELVDKVYSLQIIQIARTRLEVVLSTMKISFVELIRWNVGMDL